MPRIRSFLPIADPQAETLILGSMPGAASLKAGQYYAHPQNQFWRIIAELLGLPEGTDYADRVQALGARRIALWDVLDSCVRPGSMDSAITGEAPNDFRSFFLEHRRITRVFFNGAKAEASFRKHCRPVMVEFPRLHYHRLPSTSPAHAGLSYSRKLMLWREAAALPER